MAPLLYAHQFGFRRGHSTQQAIISLIDKITKAINTNDIVISVFINLKKAFDCVPTDILLAKLQAYGIRGDYINWFKSYLTDRTQYVHFNGENSSECTLQCGVPQGSILGPLFFKLTLNVDRTFYMIFHRTRIKTDDLSLRIGQGTLKETSQHKYLGLIIDNKLNWSAHISHVKK